jgi:type I restriction enzyme R subunit
VHEIIETHRFTAPYTNSSFTVEDLKTVPPKYRKIIPDYIKDYVSLNQFVA